MLQPCFRFRFSARIVSVGSGRGSRNREWPAWQGSRIFVIYRRGGLSENDVVMPTGIPPGRKIKKKPSTASGVEVVRLFASHRVTARSSPVVIFH